MIDESKVIVALDVNTTSAALRIANSLGDKVKYKIGGQLFTREGPSVVHLLQRRGFSVFLDLKLHDIPNTVAQTSTAISDMGVWMFTVHCGHEDHMEMISAAVSNRGDSKVVAVTSLTSVKSTELSTADKARLALNAGADGVVVPGSGARPIREMSREAIIVSPGIRRGVHNDDQVMVVSPEAAVGNGSDYLVVGRPITENSDYRSNLNKLLGFTPKKRFTTTNVHGMPV